MLVSTAPSMSPASSAVRRARISGLTNAWVMCASARTGPSRRPSSSPSGSSGRSVTPVCCPLLLHSVCPCRTTTISPIPPSNTVAGTPARRAVLVPAMTTAQLSDTFRIGGDLPVHRLGYGAMQLPGPGVWGEPADRAGALRVVRAAVEQGVDFIDTADSYGPLVSEQIIADALHPYPGQLVIGTKAGLTRQGPGVWTPVGRPAYLKQQVELSLRHLKVDRIDLIQLHRIDAEVPLADQLGAFVELKEEGKVRHIGVS